MVPTGGSGDSDVVDEAPDQGSGGGGGQGPGPVVPNNPPVIYSGTDTTSSGQPTSAGPAASARSQATPAGASLPASASLPSGPPTTQRTTATRRMTAAPPRSQTTPTRITTTPPASTSAPKPEVATPMAPYSYVCTISEAWRGNTTYLPPDNACDYLFYDSLYKDNKNALIDGIQLWDAGAQQFVAQASVYKHTKLGFSFADKTFFTPSMFISIAHLPYSVSYARNCRIIPVAMAEPLPVDVHWNTDGHTVNDSLDLLREVAKLGLSIPLAMSFGMRGLVYAPKFLNEAAPTIEEFQLLKPCKDFEAAKYEDPKKVCAEGGWIESLLVPGHAYNINQRKAFTYLTERRIAVLACDGKQFSIDLDYGLAAYDVDYDAELSCAPFGFLPLDERFGRVTVMRKLSNFLRAKYTDRTKRYACQELAHPPKVVP
ncbi:uncharacterized protein [Dermacentor albipictus]|uniref:uncharacterized protein isoform X6 n=1 Tax=Dermacentor albipictus TaxID=60249 RepID=UPI0038FCE0ED